MNVDGDDMVSTGSKSVSDACRGCFGSALSNRALNISADYNYALAA